MVPKEVYLILLIFSLQTIGSSGSSGFYYNDTPFINSLRNVHMRNYYLPFQNETLDLLKLLTRSAEINPKCQTSLKRWISGIEENELWALKFLEATGKTINGKLTGLNANFGSFDHCTSFERDPAKKVDFDGKYCLVGILSPEAEEIENLNNFKAYQSSLSDKSKRIIYRNLANAHGLCMPHTCRIEEITLMFNKLFNSRGFRLIPPESCTTVSEPEPLTGLQIASLAILGTFIMFCVLASFIKNDYLACFSLSDNHKYIYGQDSKSNENDDSRFLHGIKFILIIVSISLHAMTCLGFLYAQPYAPVKESEFSDFLGTILNKCYIVADNMFFIGGFYAMFAWHDVVKSGKVKFNFFNFFMVRYFKVASIAAVMILITFVMPHLGSGPFYADMHNHLVKNCKSNFWNIFLLVSNEQRVLDMCIPPSWYLSADFQIYILNYFVIYYLIVRPRLGFLLAFVQCCVVSAFSLFFIHHNKIVVTYNFFELKFYDGTNFEDTYLHSFYHNNTYVTGMICAWLVKNRVRPRIFDFKIFRFLLGLFSLSSFYVFLKYLEHLERNGGQSNHVYFYYFLPVIDKLVCSITMFYIFYSVLIGHSNWLRKMLSLRFFVPWSRMSFSLIICQFTYLFYQLGSTRTVYHYNRMTALKETVTGYFFTFVLGNFIFLFFEQPLTRLFQKLAGIKRRSEIASENGLKSDQNNNPSAISNEKKSL